jgi:hypothetical protein
MAKAFHARAVANELLLSDSYARYSGCIHPCDEIPLEAFVLKTAALVVALFNLIGCAMTHPGRVANSEAKDVVISVDRNSDLSDSNYLFLEYTIENTTKDWKDVQVVQAGFEGQDTEILTGDKLEAWIEGAELKLQKSRYNTALLLGSVAAVGGVAAVTSGDPNVQVVGVSALAGSTAVAAGQGISHARGSANSGAKGLNGTVNVPKLHAFVPSKVAPESYIRRWIVVRVPPLAPLKPNEMRPAFQTAKLISKAKLDATRDLIFAAPVEIH